MNMNMPEHQKQPVITNDDALIQEAYSFPGENIVRYILGQLEDPKTISALKGLIKSNYIFKQRVRALKSFLADQGVFTLQQYQEFMVTSSDKFITAFASTLANSPSASISKTAYASRREAVLE